MADLEHGHESAGKDCGKEKSGEGVTMEGIGCTSGVREQRGAGKRRREGAEDAEEGVLSRRERRKKRREEKSAVQIRAEERLAKIGVNIRHLAGGALQGPLGAPQDYSNGPVPTSVCNRGAIDSKTDEYNDVYAQLAAGSDAQRKVDAEEVGTETTWKLLSSELSSDQRFAATEARERAEKVELTEEDIGRFEEGAPEFWDLFYARNQNNFFRERNYLWHSFPLLEEFPHTHGGGEKSTCSVGEPCASESSSSLAKGSGHQDSSTTEKGKRGMGVGYMDGGEGKGRPPGVLMEVGYALTSVRVLRSIADFILTQVSLQLWHWQAAIEVLKQNPLYDPQKCNVFVADPAHNPLPVASESVDIATMIFMLSAVNPCLMPAALAHVYRTLRPGGALLFRDYGVCDLTHVRFIAKGHRKLDENFYVRGDGTRTYFFSLEKVQSLLQEAGFETEAVQYDTRELKNRKRKIIMPRVWVHAIGRKPLSPCPGESSESAGESSVT